MRSISHLFFRQHTRESRTPPPLHIPDPPIDGIDLHQMARKRPQHPQQFVLVRFDLAEPRRPVVAPLKIPGIRSWMGAIAIRLVRHYREGLDDLAPASALEPI